MTNEPRIETDPESGEVTAYDDERRIMAIGPDEATAQRRYALALAQRLAADPAIARATGGRIYAGPPDSIDEAWAAAEAALPEGWILRLEGGLDHAYASAFVRASETVFARASTPAAALRALAAKLREAK